MTQADDQPPFAYGPINRRRFLAQVATLPLAHASARLLFAQQPPITSPSSPNSRAFNFAALDRWLTPNDEFFVRSHFGVPKLDAAPFMVKVTGEVERERRFTLDDLMRLPAQEAVVTMECAGNLVGWGGVSNARWTGVRLSDVLKATGLRAEAREVVLIGADGGAEREAGGIEIDAYARSIPISKAMEAATLLVFRMNGEPLPASHGGPLRALVAGWYGMDSVKWLKQITIARAPFAGFYQSRRYYEARRNGDTTTRGPLGATRLKSQIARPINNAQLALAPVTIFGAAWCGDAEIARVEVTTDGGQTWREAKLGNDRAPQAWRLWSYEWQPAAAGTYVIAARAYDTRGRTQPIEPDPQIITPYANNWIDRRTVEVK
jgi:DMSO/TMAO reductase YedYZ molybdopterin-dependent catalytic subunit